MSETLGCNRTSHAPVLAAEVFDLLHGWSEASFWVEGDRQSFVRKRLPGVRGTSGPTRFDLR